MDPESSHDYDNKYCYNGYKVQTLLAEYKNSGKEIIAMFSGHNHVDAAFTSPYLSIMTNCQRFENENGDPNLWPSGAIKPYRQLGTYTEDCWDVVVIRPESRKINLVRVWSRRRPGVQLLRFPDNLRNGAAN